MEIKKAGRAGHTNCPGDADTGHKAQAQVSYLFNTVPLKSPVGPCVEFLKAQMEKAFLYEQDTLHE